MKNYAFLFPGQGAQYVGMAKEFYSIPTYKNFFENTNKSLGFDLTTIMLEGPAKELQETYNTQPAILLHSYLAYRLFTKKTNIKPLFFAGHSLGEFSALLAADVINFSDAIQLVHKRGKFMVEANDGTPYKMAAILGLDSDKITKICNRTKGIVGAANFNTPKQTVISGEESAVTEAMRKCTEAGALKTIALAVGGAFHSPLIKKSSNWLYQEMSKMHFKKAKVPVISNYTAKPELEPEEIIENLAKQIISPVLWVDSVKYILNHDVDIIVEFGPKKIVSRMIRSMDRNIATYSVSKPKDVNKVIKKLEI